jgi:hypothetical protein
MGKKVLAVVIAVCLAGCGMPDSYAGKETEIVRPVNFEMRSELFEEAGVESGLTVTRMRTNDTENWTRQGYTLWTAWGADNLAPFTDRTVEVSKPKGYSGAGYGVVICQGTRIVEGKTTITMLTVMINNNGQYALGKVIGGGYEDILWWTGSPYINSIGAGSPTTIRVSYDGVKFWLYFNNMFVRNFADNIEPVHSGGRNGYIVVIAPADKFPEEEVEVYFKEAK